MKLRHSLNFDGGFPNILRHTHTLQNRPPERGTRVRASIRRAWTWQPHRRYACEMRPLRYSINVTLDGCCDHRAMLPDADLHRHSVEILNQADALLFGRVTYGMMEAAFRPPAQAVARPDWMEPFARTINAAKKYVVSSTLDRVDWNAELVRGDLGRPFSGSSGSRVRDCLWEA